MMVKDGAVVAVIVMFMAVICTVGGSLPVITSAQVMGCSLVEHHTDWFNLEKGWAVRRGQTFGVKIQISGKWKEDFVVVLDGAGEIFNATKVHPPRKGDQEVVVTFNSAVSSPIGKYNDLTLTVASRMNGKKSEAFLLDGPLYLLFNPWLLADKVVYLPTEAMRQEHIVKEYGNVFQGTPAKIDADSYHYGQSNQIALDAAFYLLENITDRSLKADPIFVAQTLSQNQGMMRRLNGTVLVGSEGSILEGNWGDFPFNETNAPELWTSVIDILDRWNSTKTPVKYGQCWVFAALLNTLVRAIGIGGRQVTAFGSWLDNSNRRGPDHKLHHVADDYYDINGTTIYQESQAWNFHSWTDIWLTRDKEEYSGWQTQDGTPPGKVGPASVRATHDLDETYPFQVDQVISTVHSTSRSYLVECSPEHKKGHKLDHCKIEKLLKYNHRGLPLIVTSKTLKSHEFGMENITSDYIDPETDAYIPWNSTRSLRALGQINDVQEEDAVVIRPDTLDVIVGTAISGAIEINTRQFVQSEFLQLNMMFTLETYQGHEIKQLQSLSQRVLVKGSMIILPYSVDASVYLQTDLGSVFVKIVVTGVSENGKHFLAVKKLDIDCPDIIIRAPKEIVASPKASLIDDFQILASFRNPLQFDIENVTLTIHSHQLEFSGKDKSVTSISTHNVLKAGQVLELETFLRIPEKPGVYYVLASLGGDYLPFTQGSSVIIAVEQSHSSSFSEIDLVKQDNSISSLDH